MENVGSHFEPKAVPVNEELAHKILSNLDKSDVGEQTMRWLVNPNQDIPLVPAEAMPNSQAQIETAPLLQLPAVIVVDNLFDDFQRYTSEFNKLLDDSLMHVNCERPAARQNESTLTPSLRPSLELAKEPILCQGHLATQDWAMIIQGQEHKVSAYLVPIDHMLGFDSESGTFAPHLEMVATTANTAKTAASAITSTNLKAVAKNLSVNSANLEQEPPISAPGWTIDGTAIREDMLSTISKKLFAALVRVLNGEGSISDKFELHPQNGDQEETDMPLRPGYDEEYEFLAPDLEPQTANANRRPRRTVPSVTGSVPAAPAAVQLEATASGAGPDCSVAFDAELTRTAYVVASAIDTFNSLLEQQLNDLAELSVKAMQTKDIVCLQRTIKQQAAVKSILEEAAAVSDEWKALLDQ